ncbi:ABC transporter permease [Geomonas sp. Red32]|uniref:ABC transporter permease n=1 Tax=Geomonas sp. Red32 TaxID=2912856 RepID=UPI00202D0B8C|nr:ABC transporter permease [Geomonas sp. Red32]MCM0083525.1 ABC transporter permease [Geomonas sp. Red32]
MVTALLDGLVTMIVYLYDLTEMILKAFRDSFLVIREGARPVLSVYLRQVYFTGLEAVKIVISTALIIGTVVITQIVSIAGTGSESLTGKVLVWIVVRELGPLLTAIIVVARSGTAIAAELSQMKIGGEIESLALLGIPPEKYLILPRIFGVATAVVVLTIYFEIGAVLGSFLVASFGWHVPWEQYSQGVFAVLTIWELALSLLKSLLFGLFIGAICCRQGLSVGKSVTQIPQAATKAVMQSLFLLFIIDGIISLFFLIR